jgi:glycosyltransferase involved in cell wall biosynthesis
VITHRIKGTRKQENINGVKIYRVNVPFFGPRYWFTFLSIPKVLELARNADIIHTTTFNAAFPSWLASKILGKPSLITVHEVWVGKWREFTDMNPLSAFVHDALERMIYALNFHAYVCVSESTKENLVGVIGDKKNIFRVYNGFDYDFFDPKRYKKINKEKLGLSKNSFVCLAYGRPGVSKGFDYLIKAVPKVRIKNFRLLLILSKDKRYKKIIGLVNKLNSKYKNKIKIMKPVGRKELNSYIRSADCVVVPSLTEGFGYSAVEACALGTPIVVSNTTSLPEVVFGKYVLVKPKSSEAIATGIDMVHDKAYMKTKKKLFTIQKNVGGYISIYEKLLKSKKSY